MNNINNKQIKIQTIIHDKYDINTHEYLCEKSGCKISFIGEKCDGKQITIHIETNNTGIFIQKQ